MADKLKPITKETLDAKSDDAAVKVFDEIASKGELTEGVDYRALLWKIDLRLVPLLAITYMLQSIDKTTLGYAAVFDLREETHLHGTQYSWLGSIFYLGYLIWEYPTGLLLQKLPVNKFMSATVIVWGIVLMCHAAANDFRELATARAFLGAFEASINPGTMLIFAMYYKRSEQPFRMGIWIGSAGVAYVLAGIGSFGIGHINGALSSWQYMFLIWGAVTTAWGCVLWFLLPGPPHTAKFLSAAERRHAVERVKENDTGIENKVFKKEQFMEAIMDIKTWLLFTFAVSSNSPNGGLTTFQGLIIKGMGFSTLETTLIQMPSGGIQFVVCVTATYLASHFRNARLPTMIACLAPFLAGVIGLHLLTTSNPYGRLTCLWICFSYTASWTLSMSVSTANTAGHTKKVTTNAILIIGYCLGNFIGPFFFLDDQAPTYGLGVGMMFFCIVVQVLSILGIWGVLWRRNRRRGREVVEGSEQQARDEALLDLTDWQKKYFKVSFYLFIPLPRLPVLDCYYD
ncbi:MAG: hypothetical protein M1834_000031 [Cirrosporium novae-zelandiae]|nr:MAG: hypothetical protein M1834_000031 [Cirrosporium novae-zelandiae]